jgi:hypothetical protein
MSYTKTYDKLGICFQYPDSWRLDEADAAEGRQSVTVYSPGGGFWCVAWHPSSAEPAMLAKKVVSAMREEYSDLEAEAVSETHAGEKMIGYDFNFYCLDFTNSAQIRSFRLKDATYSIFCQAEDREFEEIQSVFQALTHSLLAELSKQ